MAEGRALEALGVTSEYVVGASMYAIMKNVDPFFDAVERTLAGQEVVGTIKVARTWLEVRLVPQRDEHGAVVGAIGVGTNVTDRRTIEQELLDSQEQYRTLAFHDALTGLPNRALFGDRLELALRRAARDQHAVGGALSGPGQLQGRQRQPGPSRRRRSADRRSPAASTPACGPKTRPPASAATSSRC